MFGVSSSLGKCIYIGETDKNASRNMKYRCHGDLILLGKAETTRSTLIV